MGNATAQCVDHGCQRARYQTGGMPRCELDARAFSVRVATEIVFLMSWRSHAWTRKLVFTATGILSIMFFT